MAVRGGLPCGGGLRARRACRVPRGIVCVAWPCAVEVYTCGAEECHWEESTEHVIPQQGGGSGACETVVAGVLAGTHVLMHHEA